MTTWVERVSGLTIKFAVAVAFLICGDTFSNHRTSRANARGDRMVHTVVTVNIALMIISLIAWMRGGMASCVRGISCLVVILAVAKTFPVRFGISSGGADS